MQDSAKSAPRMKQGHVDIIVSLKTESLKPLTLYAQRLSEAASQVRDTYVDNTWVNKHFTVRVSVKVGEIRPLKRLRDQGNDFDLTITPLFSTAIITELGSGATITNNTQEYQNNTNETSAQLTAQIKGGPFEGYPPLTVHFLGNPTNDTRIVSYHWTFGPTSKLIAPESLYHNPRVSILLLCLMLFYVNPLLFITSIGLYEHYLTKSQSRYESTERDPAMVLGSTGNYWATLTVTDAQGRTASDTMWITVLQVRLSRS